MTALLLKYWRFVLPVLLMLVISLGFIAWVDDQKQQAVSREKQRIEAATAEQVEKDKQIIMDAFVYSPAIDAAADRMLADKAAKASVSDRLLSTEVSATVPSERDAKRSDSLGNDARLSAEGIRFIQDNWELLQ